jgi:hypothetical protein
VEEDSEAGDMPGVRTGLKLKSIDGDAVVDHASAMAAIADGHRPMTLVLVEDNARIAKNKLKTAIKLGGMRKAKTPAVEKEEDIVVELHQHVIVNGKPWEVVELDSPPGMVQLPLPNPDPQELLLGPNKYALWRFRMETTF